MNLPPSVSEEEFVRVTDLISKKLFKKYGTLHGSPEDFAQQVVVWSILAMTRYDPRRPLEAFLLSHARNRALNWIRDHHYRSDTPCPKCHSGSPCGADGSCCRKYLKWRAQNDAKASIARPMSFEQGVEERSRPSTVETEASASELARLIDEHLPLELRGYYLKMLAGVQVKIDHRYLVQDAVSAIINGDYPEKLAMADTPVELPESDDEDDENDPDDTFN